MRVLLHVILKETLQLRRDRKMIPMLIVAYSSHFLQRKLSALSRHEAIFRYVTGGVLIAFGLYSILVGNFAFA